MGFASFFEDLLEKANESLNSVESAMADKRIRGVNAQYEAHKALDRIRACLADAGETLELATDPRLDVALSLKTALKDIRRLKTDVHNFTLRSAAQNKRINTLEQRLESRTQAHADEKRRAEKLKDLLDLYTDPSAQDRLMDAESMKHRARRKRGMR